MDTIAIEDAEKRLADLARRVEQGETIVLTRNGQPIADLVPHKPAGGLRQEAIKEFKRQHGIDKIVTYIAPDFDDPLPEDFLITPEKDAEG
jgi:prevent-host-death family protein